MSEAAGSNGPRIGPKEAAGSNGPKNGPNGHTDGPDASARLFAQDLSRLV
jgi:hypothetical protein